MLLHALLCGSSYSGPEVLTIFQEEVANELVLDANNLLLNHKYFNFNCLKITSKILLISTEVIDIPDGFVVVENLIFSLKLVSYFSWPTSTNSKE